MKSFLVIGLGSFGRHLACKLIEFGNEVMVLDIDEERVADIAPMAAAAYVGDCQDEQVLASLGVQNFDVCFVCVRDDLQSSLEATSTLKELGAKSVVARADRKKQIKFLKKIGADYVIHTEMDMAHRTAIRFSVEHVFDYFEMTPKFAVFEMEPLAEWIGKTVTEVDVRRRYNVIILGVKNGDEIEPLLNPLYRFVTESHLVIAGDKDAALRIMSRQA